MQKRIINIGILAHVDAGKTTITENMLFMAGQIRQKGSVDAGSTITDSLDIEKQRGISVKAAATSFEWNDTQINLIDTPGHADFSAEVERCLSVLDGAILVLSAVEGVQAHTYNLWDALQKLKIPTLIVINKMDRQGADYINVLEELKSELQANIFPLQASINDGLRDAGMVDLYSSQGLDGDSQNIKDLGIENLANFNETLLEKYLDGEQLDNDFVLSLLQSEMKNNKLVPVLAAIAKEDIGTHELLNAVTTYFPQASRNTNDELSALVFKIEHDKTLGRLAHVRVFAGKIASRNVVLNASSNLEGKISQIKKVFTNKLQDVAELSAGDVGVIAGLSNVLAGNIIGNMDAVPESTVIQHPVLTVNVSAVKSEQYAQLAQALSLLNAEDPLLDFTWFKEQQEMHLKLMGKMQIEILQSVLDTRFGIEASFAEPSVIYKETVETAGVGVARYTMPKPCWAVLTLKVEPSELGSGITYKSEVSVDKIARKYQNEIEQTIPKALKQGVKGWEVTDLKITLVDGEDHVMHSRPGDFILAVPMALMRALQDVDTCLLEPIFDFEIKANEELLGNIASDLTNMRAEFTNPEFSNGKFKLRGSVPVSTSMDYSIKLSSVTGGKGKIKQMFSSYKRCDLKQGKVREYKGVNPLNESQWILHNRGAFKADERKL